jgi:hypothetical protein
MSMASILPRSAKTLDTEEKPSHHRLSVFS